MTTNADYTFTPYPSPEEIQDQWNVSLRHLNDESENHAIATILRSIWRENWWKYPDDIKRSFLSATFKTAITKSNAKGPSAHALYKASISFSSRYFDWGVWLVLRVIYFDVHLGLTHHKALQKLQSFRRGLACELIKQRYQDVDVLWDNVPPTFPPRPHGWTSLDDRGLGGSRRARMYILASTTDHSTNNYASTDESDGSDSDDETTDDESDNSPSPEAPANEGDHHDEKEADTPNNSNGRSDEPVGVPKSLPKRSISDDEEEDSPCDEHTQKRRCTSSDQNYSTESEAMPNSGLQTAIIGEDLDRIYELWKKDLDKMVAEFAGQQVTQRVEGLQPRLKDMITQFLSEKIFGSTESSGLSRIVQRVNDITAEQMASNMVRQFIQQATQQLTRELTSQIQPEADKQMADCFAEVMMDKLESLGFRLTL